MRINRSDRSDTGSMSHWLEQTVQGFLAHLNWDNRPLLSSAQSGPAMAFVTVAGVMESIPWAGDPDQLSAQSLQQATAMATYPLEEEDIHLTLSDLSSLF